MMMNYSILYLQNTNCCWQPDNLHHLQKIISPTFAICITISVRYLTIVVIAHLALIRGITVCLYAFRLPISSYYHNITKKILTAPPIYSVNIAAIAASQVVTADISQTPSIIAIITLIVTTKYLKQIQFHTPKFCTIKNNCLQTHHNGSQCGIECSLCKLNLFRKY